MKRKSAIILVLAVMLGITGYLNFKAKNVETVSNPSESEYIPIGESVPVSSKPENNIGTDYFKKSQMDRETKRAETTDMLNDIIKSTDSGAEAKASAEAKLIQIAENISKESTAENLIKAKGYSDVLVFIGEGVVDVVVKADTLTASDTSRIRDIVFEQTDNNNIKIVAVK